MGSSVKRMATSVGAVEPVFVRSTPWTKRNRDRIDIDTGPPRYFVTVGVQFAVVDPTDGNRVLVADLSSKSSRLGEAEMMRFARGSSADYARLPSNELAVLLVTQANGLRRRAATVA